MPRNDTNGAPLRVEGYHQTWSITDDASLDACLSWRDEHGGAIFWLAHDDEYPTLAIRATGDLADIHYFPSEGHPGFRCLGGDGLPEGGMTTLVFPGCDPATGEQNPNEFIVHFETARLAARDFFHSLRMLPSASWFEL
jgi:hypothetical protein